MNVVSRTGKLVSDILKTEKQRLETPMAPSALANLDGCIRLNQSVIPEPLYDLYTQVKTFLPRGTKAFASSRDTIARDLLLYREDDVFSFGTISYKIHNNDGYHRFSVSSRLIKNKVGVKDKNKAKLSKNIDAAVRNAKKYLVPWSAQEVVSHTADRLGQAIGTEAFRESAVVDDAARKVGNKFHRMKPSELNNAENNSVLVELANFRGCLSGELGEAIDHLLDVAEKERERIRTRYRVYMVVSQEGKYHVGKVVNDSYELFPITKVSTALNTAKLMTGFPEKMDTYAPDDLPEWLAGKLTLLSMVDSDQSVEGVGCRMGHAVYCVLEEA